MNNDKSRTQKNPETGILMMVDTPDELRSQEETSTTNTRDELCVHEVPHVRFNGDCASNVSTSMRRIKKSISRCGDGKIIKHKSTVKTVYKTEKSTVTSTSPMTNREVDLNKW